MKRISAFLLVVVITGTLSNLQAEYSVDGYVGNNGTSCSCVDGDGCVYIVTSHRMFFGLIRWNTEELFGCPNNSGVEQPQENYLQDTAR